MGAQNLCRVPTAALDMGEIGRGKFERWEANMRRRVFRTRIAILTIRSHMRRTFYLLELVFE
jgi:hypothetical protein